MTTLLAGCRTASSDIYVTVCPAIVPYTKPSQQQAVKELNTLPKGSQIGQMITDYGKLRDACRSL